MVKTIIAGFFDPIQPGHLELFRYAKDGNYSDDGEEIYVIAIIHSPQDIMKKSGFYIYEPEELKEILLGFGYIDDVVIAKGSLVEDEIRILKPNYFVKGPDRNILNMPIEELNACEEVGCKVVYQSGYKINSSSSIKGRIRRQIEKF